MSGAAQYVPNPSYDKHEIFSGLLARRIGCWDDFIKLVEKWNTNPPSEVEKFEVMIKENESACFTLFCPGAEWTYEKNNIRSKSKNSPFIGKKLTGKVIGIINKDQVHLNP